MRTQAPARPAPPCAHSKQYFHGKPDVALTTKASYFRPATQVRTLCEVYTPCGVMHVMHDSCPDSRAVAIQAITSHVRLN